MIAPAEKRGDGQGDIRDVDLSGLVFPSDRLTIEQLRKAHADLFDYWIGPSGHEQPKFFCAPMNVGHTVDTLGSMLHCERLTALTAYAKSRGLAAPYDDETLAFFQESLEKLYLRYGLASGPHHVAELIRDIERQGRELAKQRQP